MSLRLFYTCTLTHTQRYACMHAHACTHTHTHTCYQLRHISGAHTHRKCKLFHGAILLLVQRYKKTNPTPEWCTGINSWWCHWWHHLAMMVSGMRMSPLSQAAVLSAPPFECSKVNGSTRPSWNAMNHQHVLPFMALNAGIASTHTHTIHIYNILLMFLVTIHNQVATLVLLLSCNQIKIFLSSPWMSPYRHRLMSSCTQSNSFWNQLSVCLNSSWLHLPKHCSVQCPAQC